MADGGGEARNAGTAIAAGLGTRWARELLEASAVDAATADPVGREAPAAEASVTLSFFFLPGIFEIGRAHV